jgi:hypothetical protein
MTRYTTEDEARADMAAIEAQTGKPHFVADSGPHVWPRFAVCVLPAVGMEVSEAFNGDYYPCGKIAKVSPSLHRIETDEHVVFTRRVGPGINARQSPVWKRTGQETFTMVPGRVDRRNPDF